MQEAPEPGAQPSSAPPLRVSGLVVSRADLVAALRVYVPQLVDVTPLDGERFLLTLMETATEEDRRPR